MFKESINSTTPTYADLDNLLSTVLLRAEQVKSDWKDPDFAREILAEVETEMIKRGFVDFSHELLPEWHPLRGKEIV